MFVWFRKFISLFTRFFLFGKFRIQLWYFTNIILSFLPFSSALDVSDDEAVIIDDLVEFSLLLIDLIFRVFALFAFYSSWTTLQLESKFSQYHFYLFLEVLLELQWTSTFFGLSVTLPFRAPPCNVALNCGLTFSLSSNHILIFSFYLNTLQKHRINNDTDIFLATLLNLSFLLPLLKTLLQQKKYKIGNFTLTNNTSIEQYVSLVFWK